MNFWNFWSEYIVKDPRRKTLTQASGQPRTQEDTETELKIWLEVDSPLHHTRCMSFDPRALVYVLSCCYFIKSCLLHFEYGLSVFLGPWLSRGLSA